MFKNIRKLKNLLDNYDKIMLLVNSKDAGKRRSIFNTPKDQLEQIAKMKK